MPSLSYYHNPTALKASIKRQTCRWRHHFPQVRLIAKKQKPLGAPAPVQEHLFLRGCTASGSVEGMSRMQVSSSRCLGHNPGGLPLSIQTPSHPHVLICWSVFECLLLLWISLLLLLVNIWNQSSLWTLDIESLQQHQTTEGDITWHLEEAYND